MGMENLLLAQQMDETESRLQNIQDDENARRKKGGFWSSMGGGAGGLLGGLGAGALAGALGVATGGLAMPLIIGAGAGLGSLGGARIGADLGGGRAHDAVKLGQNIDVLSGKTKEFSQSVKDRYRKNVNQFQDNLNTNILSQAVNTGLKAGAFAYANPMIQKGLGKAGAKLGFGSGQPLTTASGEVLSQGAPANVAGAQAYTPAGLETSFAPAEAFKQAGVAQYTAPVMQSPPTAPLLGAAGSKANLMNQAGYKLPNTLLNMTQQNSNIPSSSPLPSQKVVSGFDQGYVVGQGRNQIVHPKTQWNPYAMQNQSQWDIVNQGHGGIGQQAGYFDPQQTIGNPALDNQFNNPFVPQWLQNINAGK
tara:strand:- start:269 stop:1357 length:1089 start_codon:yes stop_codon:yes gene_type:complete